MSSKRMIMIEAALVAGFLATGLVAAQAARAMPLVALVQSATDATPAVNIDSRVEVERTEETPDGKSVTKVYDPSKVSVIPGDKLIFVNSYRNTGTTPASNFVINNPVHPAVEFSSVNEDWALVSVDGGKTFGKLSELTVTKVDPAAAEGSAPVQMAAQAADVTDVRWSFPKPIPVAGKGELKFRGVVK